MAAPLWMATDLQPWLIFLIFCIKASGFSSGSAILERQEDLLVPYKFHHGPRHKHRFVRDCQPPKYNHVAQEIYPSHDSPRLSLPVVDMKTFVEDVGHYWDKKYVYGHYFHVNHPSLTLSVLEPNAAGGCYNKVRATTEDTGRPRHCILATNAGFFNTTSGACKGNVVSDGREGHNSGGIQNVHFGIRKDGSLFIGYLPENIDLEKEFNQLVGGVIWLVRDGENFIETSKIAECEDAQESGSLDYFISVQSARLAVGHDRDGRVVIAHVEGQTGVRGVNLNEFADMLISWGVVNAINLDGGGSVTAVVNNTLVNYPGDKCKMNGTDESFRCQREVTTVLCVHEPYCHPADCSGHGDCVLGNCQCHGNWAGESCDHLECGTTNCTGNGLCTEGGCVCDPGWQGLLCEKPCPVNMYGFLCKETCRCQSNATCQPQDGSCECPPGYTGALCDQICPYGSYGLGCKQVCFCENSCTCHHITGRCNVSIQGSNLWEAGQCLANHMIQTQHLVVDQPDQYRMWLITIITLSILAAGSLILNISLLSANCSCTCTANPRGQYRTVRKTYGPSSVLDSPSSDAFGEMTDSDREVITMQDLSGVKRSGPVEKSESLQ